METKKQSKESNEQINQTTKQVVINLYLTNTMGRTKQEFKPIKQGYVGMYTCGPTVYNFAHIGNLRTYVFEDVLKRVLLYNNYKVKHVMNITDVGHLTSDSDTGEDKIEKSAKKQGMDAWELSRKYTKHFFEDTDDLNIIKPDIVCKATEHIQDMIDMIKKIEKNGYTYRTSDGIYFDTAKLDDYGKLAGLNIEGLKAGIRIDLKEKKNKTDFALWKFSPKDKKRQMEWDSLWGIGFPGWHIECSAMSTKYLGKHFDIHCGGVDHIPVHHTNEIAQTETATGKKPWVNYWLHGEFLVLKEGRMGKSLGNFITLRDLKAKGYEPLAYRYLCLNTHYRKQLLFDYEAMDNAQSSYNKLKNKVLDLIEENSDKSDLELTKKFKQKFIDAINDDLNTPKALAVLWNVIKSDLGSKQKLELLYDFDRVLDLGLDKIKKQEISKEILELKEKRDKLRSEKRYKEADEIRDLLKQKGYEVLDTKQGSELRKII